MSLVVESYDEDEIQKSLIDAFGLEWSTHYGEEGGGFGYLRYRLPRPVGHRYDDIGFGYRQIVRKYLNTILFDGQIRQIEEVSSPDGDEILITAIGDVIVATDDEFLRAFCDTRLGKWKPSGEVPSGLFRPDQYTAGSNALGLYLGATTQEVVFAAKTEMTYEFFEGEVASRIKFDLSMSLGGGVLFDGTVDSIDSGNSYVYYTNDSGESRVTAGMTLWNVTQNISVLITVVDTGANQFTVDGIISAWNPTDELAVYGPLFQGQISDITGAVITYINDIGEGNLAATNMLVNLTQKSVAEVLSVDTGANTVTVTDSDHLTGWRLNDTIMVGASMFFATVSSVSTVTLTYSSPIGERVVSSVTGWVIHNFDRNETASVASWNTASNQLDVTDAAHIAAWSATEVLFIYTPYAFEVEDSNGVRVWPPTNVRDGAIVQNRTAIDVTTTGSPSSFTLRFYAYIAGAGNESSFVQLSNLKVYSTTETITADFLAKEAITVLSDTGHNLSPDETEVEAIANVIEPMVYEFKSISEAMAEACRFGDASQNPLAWGIRPDERQILYLETQPTGTDIAYLVRRTGPANISGAGDIQESAQKVRAIYTDIIGRQQVTAYVEDTDAYFGGRYRATSIRLDNVNTDAEALVLAQKYLDENKMAKVQSSYEIDPGAISTPIGLPVPFDEVKAEGRFVLIEDWRSTNTSVSGNDLWSGWATERLVGVEVNYDEGTVKIIPGSAKSTFEKYMANLARLAQR